MSSYQGYTNYETWAVCLWLDNEQGLYYSARELARDVTGYRDYERADAFKDWVSDMAPDLGASLFSDLLTAALNEVDWQEVADHYAPEPEEAEAEEEEVSK